MANRSRHNFIILQLRLFIPAGDQNLRAWMIKWHQQAAIPGTNPARVMLQVELMIVKQLQGIKRDRPQRHYDTGFYQFNSPPQKRRTVADLRSLWPAVRARVSAWIAERGAGNKDL